MIGTLTGVVLFAAADPKVAVLCANVDLSNASNCAAIQRRVEQELQNAGVSVVTGEQYVGNLPAFNLPTDNAALQLADQQTKTAVKAYYDGNLDEARNAINRAREAFEKVQTPAVDERVEYLLWRATIYLAQGDETEAKTSLRDVVTIDPTHATNVNVFSSAIAELIEKEKTKSPPARRFSIVFDAPPGASITVDKRAPVPSGSSVELLEGRHQVIVTRQGFWPVGRRITVESSDPVSFVMVPALAVDLQKAVLGVRTVPESAALSSFGRNAGVDTIVAIVLKMNEARIAVASPSDSRSPTYQPVPADATKIAEAAVTAVKNRKARPKPTPTPPDPRDPSVSTMPVDVAVGGGLAFSAWTRTVSVDAGGFEDPVEMVGIGPRIAIDATMKSVRVFAHVEGAYFPYGSYDNTIETNVVSGASQSADAGSSTHVSAAVGYRFGNPEAADFGVSAGFMLESYAANAVYSSTNGNAVMPMFASQTLAGPVIAFDASLRRDALTFGAGLGVWIPTVKESPAGTLGDSPKAAPVPQLRIGAGYERDHMTIGGSYSAQYRTITYKGAPNVAINQFADAKVDELLHVFAVSAQYRF